MARKTDRRSKPCRERRAENENGLSRRDVVKVGAAGLGTAAAWPRSVDAGVDADFERESESAMHRIAAPPVYALSIMIVWHDSYGRLRVNGRQQVIDMQGQVMSGIYAGGEAAGGFDKHGLGKGTVHGHIAGTRAASEPIASASAEQVRRGA